MSAGRLALAIAMALSAGAGAPTTGTTTAPARPTAPPGPPGPPPAPAPAATVPAPAAQAAPRQVQSRTSAAAGKLGEPIEWEIELKHAPAERYDFKDPLPPGQYRAEPLGCRRQEAPGETTTTCRLRVALLALGPVDLPPLRLAAATPDGARALDVPGPRLTGNGIIDPNLPSDQLQLKDLAPPVPLMVPSWRLLWWALGALAAALLGWRLWRWWRSRHHAGEAAPPPVPPEVRFAARLDRLEGERLGEQGRGREHWFRLSEAVRDYLGALTGLNALDLTTEELLAALRAQADPRLPVEPLRRFSETADLVKFARQHADGRACAEGVAFGRELLLQTRPVLAAPATGVAAPAAPPAVPPAASPAATPTPPPAAPPGPAPGAGT